MENYSYSYPESGDSSPRSREIEFENPPPWEDQNYKVKFMCSYGGKIHPRTHDNQLSYIGGHTKILAVDRSVKFSSFLSKLSSISGDPDVSFKYQLPGEDLDALISVSNDDDLDHMMHEYDRVFRATAKHARMRLFLFSSLDGSDATASQPDRASAADPKSNVDFLFGLEKGMAPQPGLVAKMQEAAHQEAATAPPGFRIGVGYDDHVEMQRQLHRMHIGGGGVDQAMFRRKSDDNFVGSYAPPPPADYYVPKIPEKIQAPPPVNLAPSSPSPVSSPAGFWAENQFSGGGFPATTEQQPMYMIQTQGGVYHAPVQRPVMGQSGQGFYMQRMGHDVYREQPLYNVPTPQPQMSAPPPKVTAYSEGFSAARPNVSGGGIGMTTETGAYTAQVPYDNATGRQVYYNARGGVVAMQPQPQYQGVPGVVGGDTRSGTGSGFSQEGKMVNKVSQGAG